MRIPVFGAGVIGSVYAGKLAQAGHEVVLLGRGARLADLRTYGLVLDDAKSGHRTTLTVPCVSEPAADDRSEQLTSTLQTVSGMHDGSDVLFFGNTASHQPGGLPPPWAGLPPKS